MWLRLAEEYEIAYVPEKLIALPSRHISPDSGVPLWTFRSGEPCAASSGSRGCVTIAKVRCVAHQMFCVTAATRPWTVHRLLHHLFAYAIEEDRLWRNPADLPAKNVPRPPQPRKVDVLSVAIEKIAQEVPTCYRALLWTLTVGGLRIGEATALRVGDVDVKAGVAP
jgi:hypothetical protein